MARFIMSFSTNGTYLYQRKIFQYDVKRQILTRHLNMKQHDPFCFHTDDFYLHTFTHLRKRYGFYVFVIRSILQGASAAVRRTFAAVASPGLQTEAGHFDSRSWGKFRLDLV